MEQSNVKKISLSTFFLIFTIIAIIVMGIYIYILNKEKTNEIEKSTELQSQVNNLNGTINDLQGKIDNISATINSNNSTKNTVTNTTSSANNNNVNYDVEISMSELENINYTDNTQLQKLENKYKGKTVKITGYVSSFGDNDVEPEKTFVNIGNKSTYKDKVYAGGLTSESNVQNQIKNLQIGQKISIIGVAFKSGTLQEGSFPMSLNDVKIIVE